MIAFIVAATRIADPFAPYAHAIASAIVAAANALTAGFVAAVAPYL